MKHTHTYAAEESACCCSESTTSPSTTEHNHTNASKVLPKWKLFFRPILAFVILCSALATEHLFKANWFEGRIALLWYGLAYLIVGFPVMKDAWKSIKKGDFFSEFLLMSIATLGAFAIGEYPEGVAVMLFYSVGEVLQSLAVSRAKLNIKTLLDQRPETVTRIENNVQTSINAAEACIDDILLLKPGEKVALDGELMDEKASFNTAALTGESKPSTKRKGDSVLAGMINLETASTMRVTTAYKDSKLSKILDLIQHASAQKAPTELFIRKFAKIYTPIVVGLAVLICLAPALFVSHYVFSEWLYRALIFLVISCPCALVISIPLGYFGGIGAASKNGILFKGSNYLDSLANIRHVVLDKTGTLTQGVFSIQDIQIKKELDKEYILHLVNMAESNSTHPIATAIREYVGQEAPSYSVTHIEEIAGHGLRALIDGRQLLVGNTKLLDKFGISYDTEIKDIVYTTMAIAVDNEYAGYITIADQIKPEAKEAIQALKSHHIDCTVLSGDKNAIVRHVAESLGITNYFGDLLPEDKVTKFKAIKQSTTSVAFVGDGFNDAPVLALSDVGIAMGGLGSDASIQTADVVIQDDNIAKIPMAIKIGRETKKIVWQNITLAFIVKGAVLLLGAGGIATMWEAVFADVGVSLLAILNAIRIQRKVF
ncbi:heavy metal translocating P-type ATPase [Sphingobacterium thermophilum]